MRAEPLAAVLGDLAQTMLTDAPVQVMLDGLVERIAKALPVTGVGVTLLAPGRSRQYVAAWGRDALAFEMMQAGIPSGPGLTAFDTAVAVSVPEVAADERYPDLRRSAAPAGPVALFSFPLRQGEARLGVLTLYRDVPGPLEASVRDAAQLLGDVAAAYLTNAHARRQVRLAAGWLHDRTVRDALTGLPNRVLLRERLAHASARSQRSQTAVAVLFVDLDSFTQINDTYGHRLGDDLLTAVAARLSALVRPGDTLARVSGDEFVFLCEELAHASDVEGLVGRIDDAFREPFVLAGLELAVTASVGIAYSGPGEAVTDDLLLEADTAMLQAKSQGGATHQVIDLPLAEEALDRRNLERDLHGALTGAELEVAYQPIVRPRDGMVTGVESLLRWTHPDRGPIPAAMAVTLAEGSGLIAEIGTWVLERSCRDWVRWRAERPDRVLDLSVNVSARQLMAPGFDATVATILHETGMDPAALVLEVTEGIFVEDGDRALSVLSELRRIGTRLALDDFGTGYSSLSYLRRFPVDIVKIDQSFVADLGQDLEALTMVAAVTHLAHDLGKTVTAEGVETQAQRDEVVRVGCERAQGYYFARPMTAAEFSARFN
ncbi:putative bifunctional diguanylate cyclase/phosphodiesterase [Pengzhenrongella frigida]|uniref:GGDEF and EAL domain-containing protein n=1 Tax=Pengzhenrongella frigida TaxID=1259133 RepID=A0A4Q5MZJ9_9MICO|nr:GGDEF domain-containing protein [Cellulomonas sp. HLT2-17]RYV51159.1 GGDEF and EAL domain-containing protein [Cellulomonas sp. HLT2-17]